MGYFKLKSKIKADEITPDQHIEESDYATLTPEGNFIQFEYVNNDDDVTKKYDVKPGIWVIHYSNNQFKLDKTSYVKDSILEEFISTKEITDKIDMFFNKLHVYKDFGIEVPKRNALLFGPPGTGKSTALSKVSEKYQAMGDTAIIAWPTDKFEPFLVKDFIKTFNYVGVTKLILIAEDIGGTSVDTGKMRSDSSLLSLLDNQEKTFSVPTFIISTTNFPETLLGNLTNRPGRFDDKIKVGYPTKEQRLGLFRFFNKDIANEEVEFYLNEAYCDEFTPAHIREAVLRSAIHDKPQIDVFKEMVREIAAFKKEFNDKSSSQFGIVRDEDYDD